MHHVSSTDNLSSWVLMHPGTCRPKLLVMLYEYVFLIFIILGLTVAHLISLRLSRREQREQAVIDAANNATTAEAKKVAELTKA